MTILCAFFVLSCVVYINKSRHILREGQHFTVHMPLLMAFGLGKGYRSSQWCYIRFTGSQVQHMLYDLYLPPYLIQKFMGVIFLSCSVANYLLSRGLGGGRSGTVNGRSPSFSWVKLPREACPSQNSLPHVGRGNIHFPPSVLSFSFSRPFFVITTLCLLPVHPFKTHSISRPEVIGGDRTWISFLCSFRCSLVFS